VIVYLDTSVVLRRFLRQPDALPDWGDWEQAYASVLLRVEAARAFDRLRLEGALDDSQRAELTKELQLLCDTLYLVGLTEDILTRAAQSFPTVVGTLDALHLSTALAVLQETRESPTVLTHDARLAVAAQSQGLTVQGI